jgi:N-acyl homoserine lactone hydrolase
VLPNYRVHAIRLGGIVADRSESLHDYGRGEQMSLPVYAAAIEGNGHRILVDTGMTEPERWSAKCAHSVSPEEVIEQALGHIGWKPDDVDVVINTHLHYDHSGNNLSFSQAEVFVSRAEWEFAGSPNNLQMSAYDVPSQEVNSLAYTLVSQDYHDVLRGIRLIQTPGHTPGHQSVLVNTDEGILCVTGDAANLLDNFRLERPMGTFVSAPDVLASLHKIAALSDRLLISHEPSIRPFQSSDFPPPPVIGEGLPSLLG